MGEAKGTSRLRSLLTRGYAGSCRDEDDAKQTKKGQERSERAAAAFVHRVLGDSILSCPIISQTRTLGHD